MDKAAFMLAAGAMYDALASDAGTSAPASLLPFSADIKDAIATLVDEHITMGTTFSLALEKAIDNYDFSGVMESALDEHDFSSAVESALDDFDITDKVRDALRDGSVTFSVSVD